MAEEPDSIVLRYLRRLDEKFDRMSDRFEVMNAEMRAIKVLVAGVMQNDNVQDTELANLRDRLERVERRLDIREANE